MEIKNYSIHGAHGKNLYKYVEKNSLDKSVQFNNVISAYKRFRDCFNLVTELDKKNIESLVSELNIYRKKSIPIFDSLKNSGQQALGSTIMEEFFFLLFEKKIALMNIENKNIFLGKGSSYVSLSFTPDSFLNVFSMPTPYIHTKDQDFVLGARIEIHVVSDDKSEKVDTIIPIVAIECKTYLERNMLDSCAATATRLKAAMPYCIFIVASEYMKMSNASPELTDIDEVYILCKAKNADRERRKKNGEEPINIDSDLIFDLYERIDRHLKSIWWNPAKAVELGKIINRPK